MSTETLQAKMKGTAAQPAPAVPCAAKPKKRKVVGKIIGYTILIFYCLFLFLPMYTILATSFTSQMQLTSTMSFVWWPEFTVQPYIDVFEQDPYAWSNGISSFALGFLNTLWITLIPLVVGLIVSGLSAYSFSKLEFPGKEKLFIVEVFTSMIPLGAFGIISYIFYSMIGWTGTVLPLIVPGLFGSVGTMFFLRMYFDGVPKQIFEAARIDGLGQFGCFFRMMIPLAVPAFVAQFIFGFVGGYNSYMGPLLYLNGQDEYITLQLFLSRVSTVFTGTGMENVHCAAAVLGMLPLIIIYCFSQKLFINGIAVGGGKE